MEKRLQESGSSITRRAFLGFFAVGSLITLVAKRFGIKQKRRPAMFWKRKNG